MYRRNFYNGQRSKSSLNNLITEVVSELDNVPTILNVCATENWMIAEDIRYRISGIIDVYKFLHREGALIEAKYEELVHNFEKLEIMLAKHVISGITTELTTPNYGYEPLSEGVNGEDGLSQRLNKMDYLVTLVNKRTSGKVLNEEAIDIVGSIVEELNKFIGVYELENVQRQFTFNMG